MSMLQNESRGAVLRAAVIVEGGLVLAAILIGWLVGSPPLAQLEWTLWGVVTGIAAAAPMVAGLIEARSCERFHALAEHVKDVELASFYRSLFESEARHHTTYTRLARHFAAEDVVMARLDELAAAEAEIINRGEAIARMHS